MKTKYMLFNLETGQPVSVYTGPMAHEKILFDSVDQARSSDELGIYKDRTKYGVKEVELSERSENVDPPTPEDVEKRKTDEAFWARMEEETKEMEDPWEKSAYVYRELSEKHMNEFLKRWAKVGELS